MKKLFTTIITILTVDRYYKMTNEELEQEASKYKIGEYAENVGDRTIVRRRLIIEQLLSKDVANNSRFATFISILALVVSVCAVLVSIGLGK